MLFNINIFNINAIFKDEILLEKKKQQTTPQKKTPETRTLLLMQKVNTHLKQSVLFPLFLEHNTAVAKYKRAKANKRNTVQHHSTWKK